MAEDIPEQIARPPSSNAAHSRGGLMWSLVLAALALALISAGYVGYRLYLGMVQVDPVAQLREQVHAQLAEHTDRLAALDRTLNEAEARNSNAQRATEAELATLRERLDETVRRVVQAAPPSEREWKLAEVEYLLRIANHRVTMEQDIKGALQLTFAADEVLGSMDDFGLHEVRAELAREIDALKMVPGLDVSGIYVRIEALSESVDKLQARRPRAPTAGEGPSEDAARDENLTNPGRSLWAMLAERFSHLVRIRVSDALPRRPQLSEDEVQYAHEMLRLQLEQAKLGLLRKDQSLYRGALASAAMWIRDYFDPQAVVTVVVLDELAELGSIQVVVQSPDISGALNLLRGLRRVEHP